MRIRIRKAFRRPYPKTSECASFFGFSQHTAGTVNKRRGRLGCWWQRMPDFICTIIHRVTACMLPECPRATITNVACKQSFPRLPVLSVGTNGKHFIEIESLRPKSI